jgi:hypothetical protein
MVVFFLRAVLVDFIDHIKPDATVLPCTCILGLLLGLLFTTFHMAAYDLFSSFSPSISFQERSWCGTCTVEGREMGSKATYPCLVHAATVPQSILILSFHLNVHLLGRHHPNHIK